MLSRQLLADLCYYTQRLYISQVERYEERCAIMQKEVEVIEKANLELMGELFESNVEDLKVTR